MSNLWSGAIDTHNEYIKFSEISGVTFENGKTYVIQINGSCTLIESLTTPTDGGFLVNTLLPVKYTKGDGDLYVKGESYLCTLNVAEGVSGGGGSANIESLSVTPTTSAQTITASGGVDGYSPVEVSAVTASIDANIVAGNIKKDVQILGVTGTYEGGSSGTGDVPLTRFSDDNGTEIGTHFMNFVDGSGNKYKVILLDAKDRSTYQVWLNYSEAVTDMPIYNSLKTANIWDSKETATANTQLILDYCDSASRTSGACSSCRSKSFVVGGTTYYGQLPNYIELMYIAKHFNEFDALDSTSSSYSAKNFSSARRIWSSTQATSTRAGSLGLDSSLTTYDKSISDPMTCPVLEIPA